MTSQSARRRQAAERARQARQDARARQEHMTGPARRKPDPVADRAAAAAAIYAQYAETADSAFAAASDAARQAWADCDRRLAQAWAERCRKLGELEGREIPADPPPLADAAEIQAASDAGTARLLADLAAEPAGEGEDR